MDANAKGGRGRGLFSKGSEKKESWLRKKEGGGKEEKKVSFSS